MKRLERKLSRLLLLVALLLPAWGMAQSSPVDKLFAKYANRDGMTTVNISGALLSFATQTSDNKDAEMMKNLKGIRILTVEDEELNKKLDFFKEMEGDSFFKNNGYESLMEVTEKNEVVRFYARKGEKGMFSELLLVIGGDENTIISIQGIIDPNNIAKITGALNVDVNH